MLEQKLHAAAAAGDATTIRELLAAAFGLIYLATELRGSRRRLGAGRTAESPLAGVDVH